jgi:PrtD family type I secretion system ABC transporter
MPRSPSRSSQPAARSELAAALSSCRDAFIGIGLISAMSNLLMLTGAMFMLEIYDRVLPSRSVPTLVGLATLAAGLYAAQGILDLIRGRILVRIGGALDETLSGRIYDTILKLPLLIGYQRDGLQPLRDLDSVRSFLSSPGPISLYDLPWMPVFLGVCYFFHPWIGLTALGGAVVLVLLTLLTEFLTRAPTAEAALLAATRNGLAESGRRNAEALVAMGMVGRMAARWGEANRKYMGSHRRASDVGGGFAAISKVLRLLLQSAVLGVGAYLVILEQATAGIIIAGSILAARALAPVDLAIANWKGFVAARQSWARLSKLLTLLPVGTAPMQLLDPAKVLTVENVSVAAPQQQKLIVQDVSLTMRSGHGLGIIGPSASGKSSLVRSIVGVWRPVRGRVSLDGAALDQWDPEALGRHVGYLPQDVELIAGTVAENISRFEPEADPRAIIAAAQAAGVHELILNLPDGYDTPIGEQGTALSAGQRQRVALARALYRDPFLVVLDEPSSNLDAAGEEALTEAILGVRSRGGIVIVVAHRPSALSAVDHLLVMNQGRAQAFGPKDQVAAKMVRQQPTVAPVRPLKVVPDA